MSPQQQVKKRCGDLPDTFRFAARRSGGMMPRSENAVTRRERGCRCKCSPGPGDRGTDSKHHHFYRLHHTVAIGVMTWKVAARTWMPARALSSQPLTDDQLTDLGSIGHKLVRRRWVMRDPRTVRLTLQPCHHAGCRSHVMYFSRSDAARFSSWCGNWNTNDTCSYTCLTRAPMTLHPTNIARGFH